jgi:SynChlorMet cassette radical SAM/SPASM protein ScmF
MADDKIQLAEDIPPLTTFYLYLTTGCNLACRHCWITPNFTKGELSPSQYLNVDLLRQAITEAKPLGLTSAKLTGGEPTLHPDFIEIVDLLTNEGLRFIMETNGTLIDAELAGYLKQKTSMWFVSVSLDGVTAETHDSFRNVPGSFDAALCGFKHLVTAGFKPQIIMCPHHGNIQEVDALVKLAVEIGAGSVKFNPVTKSGRGVSMHEKGEVLEFEDVLAFSRYVGNELQKRTPIPLYIGTPPALHTLHQLRQNAARSCSVRNILGILGSGEMALCGIGRNVAELCFGQLGKDDLKNIWNSHPLLRQLRKDLAGPYPDVCGDCIHARVCQTVCVAQNFLDSGHLVWPAEMCAEAESRGIFPDSRRTRAVKFNMTA